MTTVSFLLDEISRVFCVCVCVCKNVCVCVSVCAHCTIPKILFAFLLSGFANQGEIGLNCNVSMVQDF